MAVEGVVEITAAERGWTPYWEMGAARILWRGAGSVGARSLEEAGKWADWECRRVAGVNSRSVSPRWDN